jgi:hypothetical protein
MDYMIYDVEVLRGPDEVQDGWNDPEGMGFATAVAYDSQTGLYKFYMGNDGRIHLCRDLQGKLAISFNGVKFDSRVILGNHRQADPDDVDGHAITEIRSPNPPLAIYDFKPGWMEFDILLSYVRTRFGYENIKEAEERLGDKEIHDGSFSLDGLGEGTIGKRKTGHGAHAPELFRDGKFDELFAYNLNDVRLTRQLFEFIRKYRFVIDRKGRVIKFDDLYFLEMI